MAQWEIRLVNQPPVRVESDENLADSFKQFADSRRWYHRYVPQAMLWKASEKVAIHKDMVAGVFILKRVKAHRPDPHNQIGFHAR